MTKYLVFTDEQFEAGIEEMAGNMFHGGSLTRRSIGDPIAVLDALPAPSSPPVETSDPLRFTAEVQGERTVYVLITDHGDSGETYSAGPFTDEDHAEPRPGVAAALAAQINRPSSPPVGDRRLDELRERIAQQVTEWEQTAATQQPPRRHSTIGKVSAGWLIAGWIDAALAAADRGERDDA